MYLQAGGSSSAAHGKPHGCSTIYTPMREDGSRSCDSQPWLLVEALSVQVGRSKHAHHLFHMQVRNCKPHVNPKIQEAQIKA